MGSCSKQACVEHAQPATQAGRVAGTVQHLHTARRFSRTLTSERRTREDVDGVDGAQVARLAAGQRHVTAGEPVGKDGAALRTWIAHPG